MKTDNRPADQKDHQQIISEINKNRQINTTVIASDISEIHQIQVWSTNYSKQDQWAEMERESNTAEIIHRPGE